jgi:ATP-dependent DNA ligase
MPFGEDPITFYERIIHDPRGLPFSEGVVVKDNNDPTGATWYKVKARIDSPDWTISRIVPGAGKYADSAGAIEVQHPETGALSELGSLAISDSERRWIWDHRGDLEGQAVAKFGAMEITEAGAVRAGVFQGLHQSKGSEQALQIIGEHQLA